MEGRVRADDDVGGTDAQIAGALWGYLAGDALGVPYTTLTAAEIARGETAVDHGARPRPAGTWSDAGALTLAVLDSMLSVGFDVEDQAERILDWYRDAAYASGGEGRFDADERTRAAAHAIERGLPAGECGPTADEPLGGSALKLALPLALADLAATEATLLDRAVRTARILDGRPRAAIATALYASLVRETIAGSGDRRRRGEGARREAAHRVVQRLLEACERHPGASALVPAARDILGREGREGRNRTPTAWEPARPWDAVWSAFEAALAADTPTGAIDLAIRLGGETDTTAALAGGLAGAHWGVEAIPPAVLRSLRGRSVAGRQIDRLFRREPTAPRPSTLVVEWLDLAAAAGLAGAGGRLGVAALPGTDPDRHRTVRRRSLAADVDRLAALEVRLVILLAQDFELDPVRADPYVAAFAARGIEVRREPVPELDIPATRDGYQAAIGAARDALINGRRVVVVCRTGLGRASTFAACLLCDDGLSSDAALEVVRRDRPRAIETTAQEAFVRGWH